MSWCEYYGNTEPKKMLSQFLRARRHPYPTRQESRSAAGFAASRLVARAHSPESCLRWNNASHLHDRHHMERLCVAVRLPSRLPFSNEGFSWAVRVLIQKGVPLPRYWRTAWERGCVAKVPRLPRLGVAVDACLIPSFELLIDRFG